MGLPYMTSTVGVGGGPQNADERNYVGCVNCVCVKGGGGKKNPLILRTSYMEADFENLCKIIDLSPGLRGPPIARAGEARQVDRGEHGGRGPARRRRPGARAGGAPRTVAALQDAPTARRQHGHRGVPAQRGQIHTE